MAPNEREPNKDNGFLTTNGLGIIPARSVESLYMPTTTIYDDEEKDDKEEKQPCDKATRTRWMRTMLLMLGYMGTGMTYTVPGPSLMDLEIRTGASTKDITFMFTLRAFGGLTASLISGPLYDLVNADVIMGIGYALACVCIVMAPWWTNLMAMCISIGLAGFFSAAMNIGVNYCCIGIWERKNPPFLLFLSFMNHVAAAAIPPIVKLLLLPTYPPSYTLQLNNTVDYLASLNSTFSEGNISDVSTSSSVPNTDDFSQAVHYHGPGDVMVQYAFLVPGAAYAICSISHLILFFYSGCKRQSSYTGKQSNEKEGKTSANKRSKLFPGSLAYTILLLAMFALMSGAQGTLEESCYMFLFTYLVKHLGWAKGEAAIINTVLLLASFISLLIFMVVSRFIRPNYTILILVTTTFLPCLVMCVPVSKLMIWAAIACIAVGLGPLGASVVSWMNACFPMQGKLTAFFFFTVYVSRMIASITIGHVFEARGLGWFVYINVLIVSVGLFGTSMANLFTEVPYCKERLPSGMGEEKEQNKCIEEKVEEHDKDPEKCSMLESKA